MSDVYGICSTNKCKRIINKYVQKVTPSDSFTFMPDFGTLAPGLYVLNIKLALISRVNGNPEQVINVNSVNAPGTPVNYNFIFPEGRTLIADQRAIIFNITEDTDFSVNVNSAYNATSPIGFLSGNYMELIKLS